MVNASVFEFLREGRIGPIAPGMPEARLVELLGSGRHNEAPPGFHGGLFYGCLQVFFDNGCVWMLVLFFGDDFPFVNDNVLLDTHGLCWQGIEKIDLWRQFKKYAPDLLPPKDDRSRRKTYLIPVSRATSLGFDFDGERHLLDSAVARLQVDAK